MNNNNKPSGNVINVWDLITSKNKVGNLRIDKNFPQISTNKITLPAGNGTLNTTPKPENIITDNNKSKPLYTNIKDLNNITNIHDMLIGNYNKFPKIKLTEKLPKSLDSEISGMLNINAKNTSAKPNFMERRIEVDNRKYYFDSFDKYRNSIEDDQISKHINQMATNLGYSDLWSMEKELKDGWDTYLCKHMLNMPFEYGMKNYNVEVCEGMSEEEFLYMYYVTSEALKIKQAEVNKVTNKYQKFTEENPITEIMQRFNGLKKEYYNLLKSKKADGTPEEEARLTRMSELEEQIDFYKKSIAYRNAKLNSTTLVTNVDQSFIDKVKNYFKNNFETDVKAVLYGFSKNLVQPFERFAYENLGFETYCGEYYSLLAKYNDGTITDAEKERLVHVARMYEIESERIFGFSPFEVYTDSFGYRNWLVGSGELVELAAEMYLSSQIGGATAGHTLSKFGKFFKPVANATTFAAGSAVRTYGEGGGTEEIIESAKQGAVFSAVSNIVAPMIKAGGAKLLSRANISTDRVFGNQFARIGNEALGNIGGMEAGMIASKKLFGDEVTLEDFASTAIMATIFTGFSELGHMAKKDMVTGESGLAVIKDLRKFSDAKVDTLKKQSFANTKVLLEEYLYNPTKSNYNCLIDNVNKNIYALENIIVNNSSRKFVTKNGIQTLNKAYTDYNNLYQVVSAAGYNNGNIPDSLKVSKAVIPHTQDVIADGYASSYNFDIDLAIGNIIDGKATFEDFKLFAPENTANRQAFYEATGIKLPNHKNGTFLNLLYITNKNAIHRDFPTYFYNKHYGKRNFNLDLYLSEIYNKHISEIKDADNIQTSTEHIKTRNEKLEGKVHPVTSVPFVRKTITVNNKVYDVVVPKFDRLFYATISEDLYFKRDQRHFKECDRQLFEAAKSDSEVRKLFTEEQLGDILKGKRPECFSWHHCEETGKLQLVNRDIHIKTGHTGGQALWGGGRKYR